MEIYFLTVLQAASSRSWCQHCLVSGGHTLAKMASFSLCPHMAEDREQALWCLFLFFWRHRFYWIRIPPLWNSFYLNWLHHWEGERMELCQSLLWLLWCDTTDGGAHTTEIYFSQSRYQGAAQSGSWWGPSAWLCLSMALFGMCRQREKDPSSPLSVGALVPSWGPCLLIPTPWGMGESFNICILGDKLQSLAPSNGLGWTFWRPQC